VEFGKKVRTIGFDLSKARSRPTHGNLDPTAKSVARSRCANRLEVTTDASRLREADFIIVAVPTPIDEAHQPDFSPLIGASISVGRNLQKGAIVVYESTVYPGATEEVCIPLPRIRESGLKWKQDHFVRGFIRLSVSPGRPEHTLTRIGKVCRVTPPATLERVARAYELVVTAGVHQSSSMMQLHEAAKK